MDADIVLTFPATVAAALPGAPLFAFIAADTPFVALLVGLGVAVGIVIGAGATQLLRRRREARPPDNEVARSPIRRPRARLTEDPIVVALVGGDEDARARRRRRPIGTGLKRPPGDSPPPT